MISSLSNPKVKQVVAWQTKAKQRRKDGVFLAEGLRICEESPVEEIVEIYLTKDCEEKAAQNPSLWEKLRQKGYEVVTDEVFQKMSDTQSPQGFLTVLKQPRHDIDQMLAGENPLLLILENLQDPGNLGTIIRTAEGAGVSGIIMSKNTVDIYNPKTIRSTMGSIFRVPFVYVEDLQEILQKLHKNEITTYAAHLKGENYYQNMNFTKGCAFLIGNEGNGLTKEIADAAKAYIKIPMEGKLESLNAAVAASLLVYEAHRQRHI